MRGGRAARRGACVAPCHAGGGQARPGAARGDGRRRPVGLELSVLYRVYGALNCKKDVEPQEKRRERIRRRPRHSRGGPGSRP